MSSPLPRRDAASAARSRDCANVLRGALLGNLQDAAEVIERCVADCDDRETVFALPAAREEVMAALELIRESVLALPAADKADMPDVPWAAWEAIRFSHSGPAWEWRKHVWSIIHELVPVTLQGVSRYRKLLCEGQGAGSRRPPRRIPA